VGRIGDLAIYNGNIYLLDKGKNKIYKYLAGEEEFSNKIDYLKSGESTVLKEATSLAIDSSIYIGFPNYTANIYRGR
jgi:exopolysaccharide biosynthesis predicted pyruvyltransferase EpsI